MKFKDCGRISYITGTSCLSTGKTPFQSRMMTEKNLRRGHDIFLAYMDLRAAFDSVP